MWLYWVGCGIIIGFLGLLLWAFLTDDEPEDDIEKRRLRAIREIEDEIKRLKGS